MAEVIRCNDPRFPRCDVVIAVKNDDGSVTLYSQRHHGSNQHRSTFAVQPKVDSRLKSHAN